MRPDDRRQSCTCGHRYGDHATGGTKCLAASTDPDQRTGDLCGCMRWTTGPMIDARIAAKDGEK